MPLTPEELALHDRGIGASMIAAVVGVNPFSRPIDVWLQLTVLHTPGHSPGSVCFLTDGAISYNFV